MNAAGGSQVAAVPLLRNRMLRHVIVPLVVTWFCATSVMLVVANDFAARSFDRALLDSAYALSIRLEPDAEQRRLLLDVDAEELNAILYRQNESLHFAILAQDGALLAGQALPLTYLPSEMQEYRYANLRHDGQELRAVILRYSTGQAMGYIVIAQGAEARRQLVYRLLWLGSLPALLMLFPLTVWLWDRIERDLHPLAQLHDALIQRDEHDLSQLRIETSSREVAQVIKALNDLIARVERNIAMQREFAGNVAHELRTPLAGIRALAEFGLASGDRGVKREQLRHIVASTERAGRLVNQLLDLAMLEEDQVALQIVDVDLADLVRQTVLRHLDKADLQGVDLGARGLDEGDALDAHVWADTALVVGLLDNLIDNALRYGGSTVTVVLSASADGRSCTVAVEDDGPGIPADVRLVMMQRWTQGDAGEQLGQGAGLGLFLVARYARLLGSTLQLDEAEAGGGLRASVALERVRWKQARSAAPRSSAQANASKASRSSTTT